jgi:transcriptional regulator with XRE-family HTH domain
MSKATRSIRALPAAADQTLRALGRDISIARKRRRMPQRVLAERMMVNVETVQRLENGDPGVSIGIIATALWALGMLRRLEKLVSPESDAIGQAEEIRRLPRTVHSPEPGSGLDF